MWYLIFFSANRGIVEFFRTNPIVFGPFSIAHVLSAAIIVASLCAMYVLKKRSREEVKGNGVVSRGEAIEDGLIVTLLYIISLMIYYGIRRGFVL
ncbi:prolipoprotein diacylglyceryl transferase family protein [Thermoanaerobacter thermocopriae]|uniref:prolipoprotein diacylglyceryl transferase family protein n=1 Tax=Thermoanaerobacter thermocopriae TaxID=29350 RepID=UPI000A8C9484